MHASSHRAWFVVGFLLGAWILWGGTFVDQAQAAPKGENAWIELELRGWGPTLKGSVQSSSTGLPGSTLDFASTLGVNTRQNFYLPKLSLHFAENHRIWASYLNMQYAGDKTITQQFNFGGQTFTVGESTHTELKFKEIAGGYQYDFLKFSRFAANLNLQVHYLDIEAQVRGNTVGTVKETIQVPIPTIGGGLQIWPHDWVKISAEFNIFKLGVSGFKGELIDSQGALTISPWDWVGLSVGYRYFRVIARDTDKGDRADWLQKGPYIGIMARF